MIQIRRIPWHSSLRCLALTAVLSSASLLNTCNVASASSRWTSQALTQIHCACVTIVDPATPATHSSNSADVVQIEEDWELTVTQPDPDVAAPQVQTVMSPFQSLDGFHICFLINYRNNPNLAVGGLEVQFWHGQSQLGARRLERDVLSTANETITWTQTLRIRSLSSDPYLCFRIVNGQSASWGAFGGSEPLHMNLDTSEQSLAGYSSAFSVANSGVTYSSNRVSKLVLKAVRGYSESGGLLFTESAPVVVYDGAASQ